MGSMNDPIADLLTRIRNGSRAQHRFVDVQWSTMKESIVKVLKEQGFVAHYLIKEEKRKATMRIFLKYDAQRRPVLRSLIRVSRPSLRRYVTRQNIPYIMKGMGSSIVSTPKGVLDGKKAKMENVGGELICIVW